MGWCEAQSGPGATRTIQRFHIISARPSKQPLIDLFYVPSWSSAPIIVSARTNTGHHHHLPAYRRRNR